MLLNEIQNKIANDFYGDIAVVAGPGSGKTRTLIERAENLFSSGESPSSILLISYTNKIRSEIRNRLKERNPKLELVKVHTFHSFGVFLLRRLGSYVDINSNFNIIDDTDIKNLINKTYENLGVSKKDYPIKRMMITLNNLFNEKAKEYSSSKDFTQYLNNISIDKTNNMIEDIFNYYTYLKRKENYLDFDDILTFTNALLSKQEALKILKEIKFVMIDEAQDLNKTQYEFIYLLKQNNISNMLLVGDFDQNIYSWRGARVDLFKQFYDLKTTKKYYLNINYRSTPEIVACSKNLISNNNDRIIIDLKSNNGSLTNPEFNYFSTSFEEMEWIVNKIDNLLKSGAKASEIAVLYRANYLSRSIESSLVKKGIKYIVYNGFEFYSRIEIKDCISLLKVLNDSSDMIAWERILSNLPNIGPKKISKIMDTDGSDIKGKIRNVFLKNILNKDDQKNIEKILNYIDKAKDKNSILDKLIYLVEKLNYKNIWDDGNIEDRLENYAELLRFIEIYDNEKLSISEFLDNISLLSKQDEHNNIEDMIKLMTLHSSKGLEFQYVFIMNAIDGIIPNNRSIEEGYLEEERRLFYVGITRAKEFLYITASPYYGYTDYYLMISRFIDEMKISFKRPLIDNYRQQITKIKNVEKDYLEIILTVCFGIFGFHHFYHKNYKKGLIYFFTVGIFGFGWIIDCIKLLIYYIKIIK